jgi:hypothetical protein
MRHLTPRLAATHDHWLDEPAIKHAIPSLQLWWHHFTKRDARDGSLLLETMEWTATAAIALLMLFCELVALSELVIRVS